MLNSSSCCPGIHGRPALPATAPGQGKPGTSRRAAGFPTAPLPSGLPLSPLPQSVPAARLRLRPDWSVRPGRGRCCWFPLIPARRPADGRQIHSNERPVRTVGGGAFPLGRASPARGAVSAARRPVARGPARGARGGA